MIEVSSGVLPGAIVRLSVIGELDRDTVQRLEAAVADAVEREDVNGLLVDFAGVTFCDSSGIAALDRAYALATQRSLPFRLSNIQPSVERVLDIVGLLDILTGKHQQ
nr:STAS domain-containing protein [uncultured Actinoplanes sp.]